MIGTLNHVAIAVPDLEAGIAFYREVLGATVSAPHALAEHGVRVAFAELGNSRIELITPLGTQGGVADFLRRHPRGGLHHVCFEVGDIRAALDDVRRQGVRVLGDGEPAIGAHGLPVAFLHPSDCNGTLIELQERGPATSTA